MSKSQINLPKTAFSMKANLPTREPEILKLWIGLRHLGQLGLEHLLLEAINDSEKGYIGDFSSLKEYKRILKSRFGWQWLISNRIARRTWFGLSGRKSDRKITSLLEGMSKKASAEEISAMLFDYKFEKYGLRFLPYLLGWR